MPELPSGLQEDLVTLLVKLGGAILLILLVYLGYRFLRRTLRSLETRGRISDQVAFVMQRVLRWGAVILAAAVVLEWCGVLHGFWTVISTVLALVAIGFVAVWSVLSNVLCSVILIFVRPFRVGDTIVLPGASLEGKVVNFNLLFTILRDSNGDLIQIPNNTFFQTPIRRRLGTSGVTLKEQLEKPEHAE